ncbi:MAG TPA: DUF6377 domain-containing protein, partial [Flavisolibacter sp.]|nr:DUF6377 domain-containing protein [Flavisolibacter sp.]
MKYILLFFLLVVIKNAFGQAYNAILKDLDRSIAQAPGYDKLKETEIETIKRSISRNRPQMLFSGYAKLYEEYKVFNYDSAYSYAQKQLNIATQLNSDSLINCARIKLSFILISSGMFKEAFDSLRVIQLDKIKGDCKTDYYSLMARCYYDLADYTNDTYHTPQYNNLGNQFLDSALLILSPASFEYLYYNGLRNIRSGKIEKALVYFKTLINDPHLTLHQVALTTSTMSDIYIQKGQIDSALYLLVKAVKADIQSSTKETSALFNLSSILFKQGDLKNASAYIEKAVKDAVFYGARQRKVQMSTILPLIEGEKIARMENERKTLFTYAAIVTFLFLLLIYLTVVIARQITKLKKAQQIITEAHLKQQEINTRLMEANKIKEEYIGFFFNA